MSTSTSRSNEVVAFSREVRPVIQKAVINVEAEPLWKQYIMKMLDSGWFQWLMTIVTLYALFGPDLFIVSKPADSSDVVINALDFITFAVFALEFLLQCAAKKDYLFSFYFYLDAFATISLITSAFTIFDRNNALTAFQDNQAVGSGSSFKAGRAARAAARAARIVRVSKLLILQKKNSKKQLDPAAPSVIGGMLSDRLSITIVSIICSMLIVTIFIQFIEVPSRTLDDVWEITGPEMLYTLNGYLKACIHPSFSYSNVSYRYYDTGLSNYTSIFVPVFSKFLFDFVQLPISDVDVFPNDPAKSRDIQLVSMQFVANTLGLSSTDPALYPSKGQNWMPVSNVRCTQGTPPLTYIVYIPPNGGTPIPLWCDRNGQNGFKDPRIQRAVVVKVFPSGDAEIKALGQIRLAMDNYPANTGDSVQQIVTMLFVIVMLTIASLSFTVDSDNLVVQPIERMVGFVKQLSQDPLSKIEPLVDSELEIDFVENNLKKLGKLLQISFGDAGSKIIASNIANEGALDVMLAGTKIDAIFGFCDIRNFTDCTECLQEDVMLFVNKIADYVHTAVEDNYGSANKNIGDAFLLCWRIPENPTRADFERIADGALLSFVKVTIECLACPILQKLTQHPKIQERMPGYRVRMGFGLHFGYAIQGAIGSAMKIDASYLSPNVNKAAFLEGSTKEFKAAILLSRQFVDLLSAGVRSLLRLIDVIKLGVLPSRSVVWLQLILCLQTTRQNHLNCGPTIFLPSMPSQFRCFFGAPRPFVSLSNRAPAGA